MLSEVWVELTNESIYRARLEYSVFLKDFKNRRRISIRLYFYIKHYNTNLQSSQEN